MVVSFVQVAEWAVPDEQLPLASQALIESDFPRVLGRGRPSFGRWDGDSLMHALDEGGWMRAHLIPLSFVGITLEEAVKAPVIFAHEHEILTPKPPRYMLCMLRFLLEHPIGDSSRFRVERDLEFFIHAYILHGHPANVNLTPQRPEDTEWEETEEQYQKRVEEGIQRMNAWDWGEIDERYLALAERVVRECQYIDEMTDVSPSVV